MRRLLAMRRTKISPTLISFSAARYTEVSKCVTQGNECLPVLTTAFFRRIGIMKEFRSFPIKGGKLALDKSVDDAIQAIVANAKKYKEQMNTAEPQRQALFSIINCRKVCHLLLVQNFLIICVISYRSPCILTTALQEEANRCPKSSTASIL